MADEKSIDKKKSGEITTSDSESWEQLLENASGRPVERTIKSTTRFGAANVFLLLDISSSMSGPDKIVQAKNGARTFVGDAVSKGYKVGMIAFGSNAEILSDLTDNQEAVKESIKQIKPYGSTNMTGAIQIASEKLADSKGTKAICLFTDGWPDNQDSTVEAANTAKGRGIDIICIGTYDADSQFLARLSSSDGLSSTVSNDSIQIGISNMAKLLPPPNNKNLPE